MKKFKFLSLVFILAMPSILLSQKSTRVESSNPVSTPPSDAISGFTYDYNKTKNIILDRVSNPNISNQDAQAIVSESSFPQLAKDAKIDNTYLDKLNTWMEKNSNLIINSFKNRNDVVQQY